MDASLHGELSNSHHFEKEDQFCQIHHKGIFANEDWKSWKEGIPFGPGRKKGGEHGITFQTFQYFSSKKPKDKKNELIENLLLNLQTLGFNNALNLNLRVDLFETGEDWLEWHQNSMIRSTESSPAEIRRADTLERRNSIVEKKNILMICFGGGSPRTVIFRNTKTLEMMTFVLEHGDILEFSDEINRSHYQTIPKTAGNTILPFVIVTLF